MLYFISASHDIILRRPVPGCYDGASVNGCDIGVFIATLAILDARRCVADGGLVIVLIVLGAVVFLAVHPLVAAGGGGRGVPGLAWHRGDGALVPVLFALARDQPVVDVIDIDGRVGAASLSPPSLLSISMLMTVISLLPPTLSLSMMFASTELLALLSAVLPSWCLIPPLHGTYTL